MVLYQHDWDDGFFHRYSYDAENRLTLVETSRDSLVWEKDARYEYYHHGPLARVTLGDQQSLSRLQSGCRELIMPILYKAG